MGEDDGSGRGPKIGCSIKLVEQSSGEDMDPNGLRYKPRGEGGPGRPGAGGLGAGAGQVVGGKVDWGHLAGDNRLYVVGSEGPGWMRLRSACVQSLCAHTCSSHQSFVFLFFLRLFNIDFFLLFQGDHKGEYKLLEDDGRKGQAFGGQHQQQFPPPPPLPPGAHWVCHGFARGTDTLWKCIV